MPGVHAAALQELRQQAGEEGVAGADRVDDGVCSQRGNGDDTQFSVAQQQDALGAACQDKARGVLARHCGDGRAERRREHGVGQLAALFAGGKLTGEKGGDEFGEIDLDDRRLRADRFAQRGAVQVEDDRYASLLRQAREPALVIEREAGRHRAGDDQRRRRRQQRLQRHRHGRDSGGVDAGGRLDQLGHPAAVGQGGFDDRGAGAHAAGRGNQAQIELFLAGQGDQFVGVAAALRQTQRVDAQSLQHAADVDALARDVDQHFGEAIDLAWQQRGDADRALESGTEAEGDDGHE